MLSSVIQQAGQGPGVPGVAQLVAKFDATAQAANIGSTVLYAVPSGSGGMYRISGYVVVTQAATTSSTMPTVQVAYTEKDTGNALGVVSITGTNSGNGVNTNSFGSISGNNTGTAIFSAAASSNINIQTSSYASSGATPMQYAVHVKLEYLGA